MDADKGQKAASIFAGVAGGLASVVTLGFTIYQWVQYRKQIKKAEELEYQNNNFDDQPQG